MVIHMENKILYLTNALRDVIDIGIYGYDREPIEEIAVLALHHQVANILCLALKNSGNTDRCMPQLETIYNQAVAADAA